MLHMQQKLTLCGIYKIVTRDSYLFVKLANKIHFFFFLQSRTSRSKSFVEIQLSVYVSKHFVLIWFCLHESALMFASPDVKDPNLKKKKKVEICWNALLPSIFNCL